VCCLTHDYRDQIARAEAQVSGDLALLAAFEALFAADEQWRCQCALTAHPCRRRVVGEDLVMLCEWCRTVDHMKWCEDNPGASGMAGRPRGVLYDEARGYAEFVREMAAGAELRDPNGPPAYLADFYQAGAVPGFDPGPRQFEIPAGTLEAGLSQVRVTASGSLTPAEIKSMLGLPKL
jgi:hypothetical protein